MHILDEIDQGLVDQRLTQFRGQTNRCGQGDLNVFVLSNRHQLYISLIEGEIQCKI
jgi:hypothetical protein